MLDLERHAIASNLSHWCWLDCAEGWGGLLTADENLTLNLSLQDSPVIQAESPYVRVGSEALIQVVDRGNLRERLEIVRCNRQLTAISGRSLTDRLGPQDQLRHGVG